MPPSEGCKKRHGSTGGTAGGPDLRKIHTPPLYLHYLVYWLRDMKGRTFEEQEEASMFECVSEEARG